jgi:hypothetical protein
MHVAATNLILWIRTLVKETLEDIGEVEEERVKNEERRAMLHPVSNIHVNMGQFHQHFTHSFFVQKFHAKLFCACSKG